MIPAASWETPSCTGTGCQWLSCALDFFNRGRTKQKIKSLHNPLLEAGSVNDNTGNCCLVWIRTGSDAVMPLLKGRGGVPLSRQNTEQSFALCALSLSLSLFHSGPALLSESEVGGGKERKWHPSDCCCFISRITRVNKSLLFHRFYSIYLCLLATNCVLHRTSTFKALINIFHPEEGLIRGDDE